MNKFGIILAQANTKKPIVQIINTNGIEHPKVVKYLRNKGFTSVLDLKDCRKSVRGIPVIFN